jgi:hypothetical protein
VGATVGLQGEPPGPLFPTLLVVWAALDLANVFLARWRFARGLARALREAVAPSR